MEHAVMCPQCNAPLSPHRFARSAVCAYCGATVHFDKSSVSADSFHEAFRTWNSPAAYNFKSWLSLGDDHWAIGPCIGHGAISDVYIGQRARFPTELVILKILHSSKDSTPLSKEWQSLQTLHASNAPGADTFTTLLPQPVMHGIITTGFSVGSLVSVFRWSSGFFYTLENVIQTYPQGIPPRASIWVWRRILEILSFIHASGMAHGAVVPAHLLVQENEHGVRLIGFSSAGSIGEPLILPADAESLYNQFDRSNLKLSPHLDIILSARCISAIVGGNPSGESLPESVPSPLAEIIRRFATRDPKRPPQQTAWEIREELGRIADQVFGPPQFIPIVMPS